MHEILGAGGQVPLLPPEERSRGEACRVCRSGPASGLLLGRESTQLSRFGLCWDRSRVGAAVFIGRINNVNRNVVRQ